MKFEFSSGILIVIMKGSMYDEHGTPSNGVI